MADSSASKAKGRGKPKATSSTKHAAPIADPRFSTLHTDPRFLKPRREQTKVVLDERFAHLLDGQGAEGGISKGKRVKVDKFGRRKGKKDDQKELRKFYKLADGDEGAQGGDGDEAEGSDEDDDEEAATEPTKRNFVDYARGEGDLADSSSSDDDDTEKSEPDSDEEEGGVTLGRSDVLARERRRKAALGSDEESEDSIDLDEQDSDSNVDNDDDNAEVSRQLIVAGSEVAALDPSALATLDAQAEAAVRSERKAAKKQQRQEPSSSGPHPDDTRRLAVVNMDWDHLRARDLYKVFASLVSDGALGSGADGVASSSSGPRRRRAELPGTKPVVPVRGSVLHVRIYPSEFGRKRMEKEDIFGPPRDIFGAGRQDYEGGENNKKKRRNKKKKRRDEDGLTEDSEDDQDGVIQVDDGEEFNEEALRKYQLERLRYYYAIATFSSPSVARHVYDTIEGTEMERTANVFDLSFVPDEMEFPEGPGEGKDGVEGGWRDEASGEDELSGGKYKAVDWRTDALRHSKVKLTWDADDPERAKVTRALYAEPDLSKKGKKGKKGPSAAELRDDDYRAYIASASEDEAEDGADGGGDRLRALLGDGAGGGGVFGRKSDEQGDMQITFLPGLSEAAARKAQGEGKKGASREDETTLEKYLRKQREKKGRRRETVDHEEDEERGEGEDQGFDDPFFQTANAGDDDDFERALQAELRGEAAKEVPVATAGALKDNLKSIPTSDTKKEREELELLLDDANDPAAGRHFDMKAVLRAEKRDASSKLKRLDKIAARKLRAHRLKAGESLDDDDAAAGKTKDADEEAQRNFELDTADPRFGKVLEDHAYALDPSHPAYVDTKAMRKLVAERRKRSSGSGMKRGSEERTVQDAMMEGSEDAELQRLVKSVKRKAMDREGALGGGKPKVVANDKKKKIKHS